MNFDQVLELVKTVSDSELTAFQYEEGNQKITMQAGGFFNAAGFDGVKINNETQQSYDMQSRTQPKENVQVNVQATGIQNTPVAEPVQMAAPIGSVVTSPLVGRFYAAPSEEAEAFVKVGDTVKKGQVLAIVEAMKLMNEIESDYDGVVTEILADNGQGVEYGQPLFRIKES